MPPSWKDRPRTTDNHHLVTFQKYNMNGDQRLTSHLSRFASLISVRMILFWIHHRSGKTSFWDFMFSDGFCSALLEDASGAGWPDETDGFSLLSGWLPSLGLRESGREVFCGKYRVLRERLDRAATSCCVIEIRKKDHACYIGVIRLYGTQMLVFDPWVGEVLTIQTQAFPTCVKDLVLSRFSTEERISILFVTPEK